MARGSTYVVACGPKVKGITRYLKNARRIRDRFQGAVIYRVTPDGERIELDTARPSSGRFVVHGVEVI